MKNFNTTNILILNVFKGRNNIHKNSNKHEHMMIYLYYLSILLNIQQKHRLIQMLDTLKNSSFHGQA